MQASEINILKYKVWIIQGLIGGIEILLKKKN